MPPWGVQSHAPEGGHPGTALYLAVLCEGPPPGCGMHYFVPQGLLGSHPLVGVYFELFALHDYKRRGQDLHGCHWEGGIRGAASGATARGQAHTGASTYRGKAPFSTLSALGSAMSGFMP